MRFESWEAVARRHVWFRDVLRARMAPWTEDAINACTDMEALKGLVNLAERIERHEERMSRHMAHGLAALAAPHMRH